MTSHLSRRELLKLAGLSTMTGLTLAGCKTAAANPGNARDASKRVTSAGDGNSPRPRNVIFMVSDGMSAGVLSLADSFSRLVRSPEAGTHWLELMKTPGVAQGMVETFSLDSMVTDSAAAASAWGSGSRVNNRSLNMLPDGRELTPLASLMKQAGRRVGLVTTTTITHATPAGFTVSHHHRDEEEAIALKYLDKVDILLGGGSKFFSPETRADKQDVYALFKAQGYTLWNHRSDTLKRIRTPQRLLGTFFPGHLPYTIDHVNSPELLASVPTLAAMTNAALGGLSQDDQPFFLMVEGGKIDHAAHANDAAAVLWEQLAFDDAVGAALKFAAGRDDTLVIVTTDHGNSNPGLNGMSPKVGGSSGSFARLAKFNASYEAIWNRIEQDRLPDALDQLRKVFVDHMQLDLLDDHLTALAKVIKRQDIGELNRQHANFRGALGQIIGNHTGIGWTGVTHTADYATMTAIGPGAHHFQGYGRNTDAFAHICGMLGIDFKNPNMKPAEPWLQTSKVYQHAPGLEMA